MSSNIERLEKSVRAAGFRLSKPLIAKYGANSVEHRRYEVERPGSGLLYDKDWMKLVSAANGYGHYIIPLVTSGNQLKGMRVISIPQVKSIQSAISGLITSCQRNYWIIQGDHEAYRRLREQNYYLSKLTKVVSTIESLSNARAYHKVNAVEYLFNEYLRIEEGVYLSYLSMMDSAWFTEEELEPGKSLLQ